MENLKGSQKRYLRSLANNLKPVIFIGKNGLSDSVLAALKEALEMHELIKVRFLEYKEEKKALADEIESQCDCINVAMVGHTLLLYRQNPDISKRIIQWHGEVLR